MVRLRDSVFLNGLVLVPGKVAQPRQRPPLLSVNIEPLQISALDLQGPRRSDFLKVRSPFRRHRLRNAQTRGQLREPIALGDVSIASRTVQFPFPLGRDRARFSLTSRTVPILRLFHQCRARTLGYDLENRSHR